MTRDEYEQNVLRFGDHIDAWPAPHRQEALNYLAVKQERRGASDDDVLDRLVFDAAMMKTDEQTLARHVLRRINQRKTEFELPSFLPQWLVTRMGVAGMAAILLCASIAGYSTASVASRSLDSALLALATGEPTPDVYAVPGEPRGGSL